MQPREGQEHLALVSMIVAHNPEEAQLDHLRPARVIVLLGHKLLAAD
jgi:hypothetical protein